MKEDREFIRDLVIDSMANGDESLDTIARDVAQWGAGKGITPSREELIEILHALVAENSVLPFRYAPDTGASVPCAMGAVPLDEMWFGLTAKGRKLLEALPPLEGDAGDRQD